MEKEDQRKQIISDLVNEYKIGENGIIMIRCKYRVTDNGNTREYYKVIARKPCGTYRADIHKNDIAEITHEIASITGFRLSTDRELIVSNSDMILINLAEATGIKYTDLWSRSQRI